MANGQRRPARSGAEMKGSVPVPAAPSSGAPLGSRSYTGRNGRIRPPGGRPTTCKPPASLSDAMMNSVRGSRSR